MIDTNTSKIYYLFAGVIIIPLIIFAVLAMNDKKEHNLAVEHGERVSAEVVDKHTEKGPLKTTQQIIPASNGQIITIPITSQGDPILSLQLNVNGNDYMVKVSSSLWNRTRIGDNIDVILHNDKIYFD